SFQNSTANTKPRSLNSLDNVSKAGHPVLTRGSCWIQYAFAAANLHGFGFGRRWRSVTMIGVRRCVDDPSVALVFNSALNFARTVYPVCTPDAPDISNKVSLDGLLKQLRVLKSVMVDWWWGIVEGYGRHKYNWNGYKRLFQMKSLQWSAGIFASVLEEAYKTKTTIIKESIYILGEESFPTMKMLSMIPCLCYIYMMIMANYLTAGALAIAHTNFSMDQSALLALKAHITSDPQNILTANWSSASNSNICNWVGVSCGAGHHRVMALNLSHMGLAGVIPPHLGNLSFLVELGLKNNSFHGPLPKELSRLRRLKAINFGNNSFMGTIPSWLGSFAKLQTIELYGNGFSGFIPAAIFNLSALEIINLSRNQLSGSIPREIGNLTMLKGIYLDDNKFEELPNEMSSLVQLDELFVQSNVLKASALVPVVNISSLTILTLYGNNMSGSLPDNICEHLPSIQIFNFARNQLDGLIPSKLWHCKELRELNLGDNNFRGSIPKSLGNLTYLTKIYLRYNNLTGTIPDEIGDLPQLEALSLGVNNLNGVIPSKLFNLSMIREIWLSINQLSGSLPANIGLNVPNLEILDVSENNLVSGPLPNLSNASKLRELDLSLNSYIGPLPSTLCYLKNLEVLNLHSNNLTIDASTPQAASTLTCLFNLRNLTRLALGENPLNTTIPASRGNLSTSLLIVYLRNSNIRGNIPVDIGNLSSLISLNLHNNQLSGAIPTSIQRLQNLQGLYLHNNELGGHIPYELYQLNNLAELFLGGNRLFGSIPSCLGTLAVPLRKLSLRSNLLNSKIPSSLWELNYLLYLNLSSNSLVGPLSEDIGQLKDVVDMDLSNNHFSGNIPGSIGGLENMIDFSLANNYLEGLIPNSFKKLLSLEFLDLSKNNLSGEIPKSLEALLYLKHLNLSFNKLHGEIPIGGPFGNFSADSFVSNGALCGASRFHVPLCKNITKVKPNWRKAKYIISGVISVILLAVAALILILCRKRNVEVYFSRSNVLFSLKHSISGANRTMFNYIGIRWAAVSEEAFFKDGKGRNVSEEVSAVGLVVETDFSEAEEAPPRCCAFADDCY
ncbi:hypothetical protein DVH24_003963, partial [Malus domestica]